MALIFAAFPVAQIAVSAIAVWQVERMGRRAGMATGIVVLFLATLGFALADGALLLAVARAAQGAGAGLIWTGAIAAVADVSAKSRLGFRLALLETLGAVGGLAAPVVAGALVDGVGTRATFTLAALLPAAALPLLLRTPETRTQRPDSAPLLPRVLELARHPRAKAGAAALALVAGVLALIEPLLPLDLDRRLGLSALGIGTVLAMGSLAFLAASPVAGRWSDSRGRRAPLVAGILVLAIGLPLLSLGPVWWVAGALIATTTGLALVNASAGPLVIESLDEVGLAGRHALAGGLLNVVFGTGYAIGPLAGGAMRAVAPFWITVLGAAILTLLAGRWILVRLRTP